MPAKDFRFSIGCLLSVVTLISLAFGGCLAFIRYADGEDTVATFDCRNGREIVICAARSCEISRPLYYLVRIDDEVIIPKTFIDSIDLYADLGTIKFTFIESSDLFAVAYSDSPSNYLMIHDFANGHSFPRGEHIRSNPELGIDKNRELRYSAREAMENRLKSMQPPAVPSH